MKEKINPKFSSWRRREGFCHGLNGTGESRVFHGGPTPLHQGRERRKMRKGMEGQGEIVLPNARVKQSGVVSQARGCRFGKEELLYLHTERQRGQRGMGDYGGETTSNGRIYWQKSKHAGSKGRGEICLGEFVCGISEEIKLERYKLNQSEG